MFNFQQKMTRHTKKKKKENMTHWKEQNKSPEIISVETQTANFLDKAINMLKEQKGNTNK